MQIYRRNLFLKIGVIGYLIFSGCNKNDKEEIPAAPSDLTYTATSTQLSLSWKDNSDNEEGFYVQASEGGSSGWFIKQMVAKNQTSTYFSIYQLEPNMFYRIVAWNDEGDSEPSNYVYVITYNRALAYIYVCPSATSSNCSHNYLVMNGSCREVNASFNEGGWYDTGFEVATNNTYALQMCQGCVSHCGQAASFSTPSLFLKPKFNTGLIDYCNNAPCTPLQAFPE